MRYGFLIHDRDSIFSLELDHSVGSLGLRVLRTRRAVRWRMASASG